MRCKIEYIHAMTERETFLKAILADPDDDTVRLAHADWLQNQFRLRFDISRLRRTFHS